MTEGTVPLQQMHYHRHLLRTTNSAVLIQIWRNSAVISCLTAVLQIFASDAL
eukprot:COSAG06_NODE_16541_length_995_cov_1.169643_2_plen_51_part_01